MTTRNFDISFETTATIEIDSDLFELIKDENWKKIFYDFEDEEEFIEYICRLLTSGYNISDMDGFYKSPIPSPKFIVLPEISRFEISEVE